MSTVGDMKKIKEWYRDGMNQGVGDDEEVKAAILDEANIAFELNSGLFTSLKPPSSPASTIPALPPLGDPTTPNNESVTPSPPSTPTPEKEETSKVIFEAPPESSETMFTTAGVLSFIAAVSLAHFILVVGGFTGSKGAAKWDGLHEWLNGVFGSVSGT